MNDRLTFEAELFADSTELEDLEHLEALDMKTSDPWARESASDSPQRVRWIQESLNKILGLQLKVDGIMGPQTRSAIRGFQQRQGLAADGVAGSKTEAVMKAAIGRGSVVTAPPHLGGGTYAFRAGRKKYWIDLSMTNIDCFLFIWHRSRELPNALLPVRGHLNRFVQFALSGTRTRLAPAGTTDNSDRNAQNKCDAPSSKQSILNKGISPLGLPSKRHHWGNNNLPGKAQNVIAE